MIVYLDASAIVKLYVEEPGSPDVARMVEMANVVGTALVTMVEVYAALARAARRRMIPKKKAEASARIFLRQWGQLHRLRITEHTVERAAGFAWKYGLRGYDAVHLASALGWREMLGQPLVLATYDRELWEAARRSDIEVWPEVQP